MELSGLALKTACHLVYTQGGSVSLCVCLYGANNITHRPFGTLAKPRLSLSVEMYSLHPLNSQKMKVTQTAMKIKSSKGKLLPFLWDSSLPAFQMMCDGTRE